MALGLQRSARLTFRHRASSILGQAFRYSPENAFYVFNLILFLILFLFLLLLLLFLFLLLYFRLCLFFQRLGRGSLDETFFLAFLRPASTAHSLWTTISRGLCQTVVLHSPHMGIPLSSSILSPFNYVLNSA